jgi:hypothetical protein
VILDAVVHIEGEQPLLADLYRMPEPTDLGLLCTNLRTMNQKRPVFADTSASVFFFPYRVIRFVEIHPSAADIEPTEEVLAAEAGATGEAEPELELDEELLRRVREI